MGWCLAFCLLGGGRRWRSGTRIAGGVAEPSAAGLAYPHMFSAVVRVEKVPVWAYLTPSAAHRLRRPLTGSTSAVTEADFHNRRPGASMVVETDGRDRRAQTRTRGPCYYRGSV